MKDKDYWEMAATEATELYNEATRALAGLVREPLKPCARPCIGHLGPKATEMYRRGLEQFEALGVELAPEQPPAEERPWWWGKAGLELGPGKLGEVEFRALVAAYEAARQAGVLPGLERGPDPASPTAEDRYCADALGDPRYGAQPAAPERPALPGWAEEGIEISMGEAIIRVKRSGGDPIAIVEGQPQSANAALLVALVEVHRRWLAMKKKLELGSEDYNYYGGLPAGSLAAQCLKIARGEEVR